MDTIIQLDFKLTSSTKLDPAQQSEQWSKFIEALEANNMSFGGGNDQYGFEGCISGPVTREQVITVLRTFAQKNKYSVMVAIPTVLSEIEMTEVLGGLKDDLCPLCSAHVATVISNKTT